MNFLHVQIVTENFTLIDLKNIIIFVKTKKKDKNLIHKNKELLKSKNKLNE